MFWCFITASNIRTWCFWFWWKHVSCRWIRQHSSSYIQGFIDFTVSVSDWEPAIRSSLMTTDPFKHEQQWGGPSWHSPLRRSAPPRSASRICASCPAAVAGSWATSRDGCRRVWFWSCGPWPWGTYTPPPGWTESPWAENTKCICFSYLFYILLQLFHLWEPIQHFNMTCTSVSSQISELYKHSRTVWSHLLSLWGLCRPAGPNQSLWRSTRSPPSCTPPAPGWTCGGWNTAAASRWWSWYTAAQSYWTEEEGNHMFVLQTEENLLRHQSMLDNQWI